MAIKMRFLYSSKQKKMKALGELIKQEFQLDNINSFDIIPPAYSCEKERLVILGISAKNDIGDVVRRFCSELNPKKASNVAVVIDGNEAAANKVIEALNIAGTNIAGDVQYLSCGLFNSKLSDEEKTQFIAWARDIVENKLV